MPWLLVRHLKVVKKPEKKNLAGSDVFKGFPWFSQPSFIAAGYLHQEYHHPVEVSI